MSFILFAFIQLVTTKSWVSSFCGATGFNVQKRWKFWNDTIMMSYEERQHYFDVWISHSYRYDVNERSALIGCQTENLPKEYWSEYQNFKTAPAKELHKTNIKKLWAFMLTCDFAWLLFFLKFFVQLICYCWQRNSPVEVNMISTEENELSNRGNPGQSDYFDRDVFLGDAANNRQ